MIDSEIILYRISEAERYLEQLESNGRIATDWLLYRADAEARRDLVSALTLIYSHNWPVPALRQNVQGPRAFRTPIIHATRMCSASEYWGVPCKSDTRSEGAVADHAWPYSLGGPTVPGNIAWLCPRHNRIKGMDIHFYPWELGWPDWLPPHLDLLAALVA